jgi:hypothetical protein
MEEARADAGCRIANMLCRVKLSESKIKKYEQKYSLRFKI